MRHIHAENPKVQFMTLREIDFDNRLREYAQSSIDHVTRKS